MEGLRFIRVIVPNLFFLCGIADSVQLILEFSGVSMKGSVVNTRSEELRPLKFDFLAECCFMR